MTIKQQIAVKKKSEKLFTFTDKDGKKYSLTLKQKLFCDKYIESLGNGVRSAMAAYHQEYGVAAVTAHENLKKPNISHYLALQFTNQGITSEELDGQLAFLVKQFANLSVKARAVDMALKIFGKYAPKKIKDSADQRMEEFLDRVSSRFPA